MKRRSFIGGAIAAVFAPLAPALKDMGVVRATPMTGVDLLSRWEEIQAELVYPSYQDVGARAIAEYQRKTLNDALYKGHTVERLAALREKGIT